MNFPTPSIQQVDRIDYRLDERPWAFAQDEAPAIDAHWNKLKARTPHLFNGRVLIMHRSEIIAEPKACILRGTCQTVDYKAFLAWRDFGFPDKTISNVFAMGALLSADGAFMVGHMSHTTANAGQIYFPAGTPDPSDVKGTFLDLDGSVFRELEEETGLKPIDVVPAPDWTVVCNGPLIACMKVLRSPLRAAQLEAQVAGFLAQEKEPELDALKPIFSVDELDPERMPDFMLRYLRFTLGNIQRETR
jgi:8-oxo-dGTP pyrophosphatase MutT (NUDIX family)